MMTGRIGRRSFLAAALSLAVAFLVSLVPAGRAVRSGVPGLSNRRARHWRRLAG
ncbi:hypothetical protein GX411_07260 [Candidatus Fermentibacteria bacterium]|nr:hypothetical protein [Candidatus Fermentibacteria bacterium]